MKVTINADVFADAISFVRQVLPTRPTLPILSGVLIEASDGQVSFSVFNYEHSATQTVTADVEESGSVLLHNGGLAGVAGKAKREVVIEYTPSGEQVGDKARLSSGAWSTTLNAFPIEEYPTLPQLDRVAGAVDGERFATALNQVIVAASVDDVTPIITGARLTFTGDSIGLVATDRYRVAKQQVTWAPVEGGEDATALIPANVLKAVAKLNHGDVTVSRTARPTGGDLYGFTAGGRTITTVQLNGTYPPVERLIDGTAGNVGAVAVVDADALSEALSRVAALLDRDTPVRFTFTVDGAHLESHAPSSDATSTDDVPVVSLEAGEDAVVVSLKPVFVQAVLKHVADPTVRLEFTKTDNPRKPGPVLFSDGHGYKYLLQPNLLVG